MAYDLSPVIISRLSHFAVGISIRDGRASKVLGSGVLVSIEGRRGIITCGHVADAYAKLPEVGLIRFVAAGRQRRILKLGDTQTVIVHNSDSFNEKKEVFDLAFTMLPPDLVSSVETHSVFLNIEKNREKMEEFAQSNRKHVDVMLGLVAEFSAQPYVEGKEVISPMRGVLHSGHLCEQENGLLTMKAMDYNLDRLPESFGGMSGGGLWRVYFEEDASGANISDVMLCGIASWQVDGTKIACQGWDRIDQALIPAIRDKFRV